MRGLAWNIVPLAPLGVRHPLTSPSESVKLRKFFIDPDKYGAEEFLKLSIAIPVNIESQSQSSLYGPAGTK